jgi:Fur family transcriptional regulator, ferric uptake regulator
MRLGRNYKMQEAPKRARTLLDDFVSKGLRLTQQRRAVIEVLDSANTHLDAATVMKLARERDASIDRATVYRTIELLKKWRLIDELDLMHLNGEKHYYEARTGRDHIHLACFGCGKILEFTSDLFEDLKREISAHNSFDIRVIRLEVGGRCKDCSGEIARAN